MARANRTYVPGQILHLTQRCHQREHLLRFQSERRRWIYWLFQARKRFGLSVLDYVVTANHVHLLVRDTGNRAISSSMQLISGRTAQEFNHRFERARCVLGRIAITPRRCRAMCTWRAAWSTSI